MASHILVFGATGQTGIDFVNLALAATPPHTITLYVRNPSKVPEQIRSNPNVTIIEGQLNDKEGLEKAGSSGATVFASFAGPTYGSKGTPVTDSLKLFFPLLIENGFRRALVLGTPSFPAPDDKGGFKWRASIVLVKLIGGSGYQEFHGLGEFVNSQDATKIPWTLFRVGFLGNGPAKPVTASYTGSGQDGMRISRKSIATWVLSNIESEEFVGKCPVISNI